jgi:hypothetical protein
VCAQHEHEQIVADCELVIVHRRFSGFRREEPDRCGPLRHGGVAT